MKRVIAVVAMLILLVTWMPAQFGPSGTAVGDKNSSQLRLLTGQVMSRNDAAIPNAVVYLKNTKTLAVKTFITDAQGNYRFPALSPNIDYEVYAEFQGRKSDTKTLSSFDSRQHAFINLKIQ